MSLSEEKNTYWKKIPVLDGILKRILKYNREKMYKTFINETNYNIDNSILDIGTTCSLDDSHNIILQKTRKNKNIYCLSDQDILILRREYPHVKEFIRVDAKKTGFGENIFDTIHSSATIEHVGSFNNQINFIKECLRIANNYVFITTPNRYYPIDFHTKLPLIHWLPKNIHRKFLKFLGFDFYSLEKNLNLLSSNDIKKILRILNIEKYKIIKINFLFFCSNFILIIEK